MMIDVNIKLKKTFEKLNIKTLVIKSNEINKLKNL
ncbi:hypothetical protein QF023_001743 [Chryseobacterium sp. SLBN-27]|nr:hypothetical protein [Chryseobacterium sp. SLBN-27]